MKRLPFILSILFAVCEAFGQTQHDRLLVKELNNIRYADRSSGADIGAKVNAAIAGLPAEGGTVYLPVGSSSFTTKIVITKPNVRLVGHGGSRVVGPFSGATTLAFTGTGTAIEIGDGVTAISGHILENFRLTYPAEASIALLVKNLVGGNCVMRNVTLVGTPQTGIGIQLGDTVSPAGTFSWTLDNVHVEKFEKGILLSGANHNTRILNSRVSWCDIGIQVGVDGNTSSVNVIISNTNVEKNDLVGIDIFTSTNGPIKIDACYFETAPGLTTSRAIRIGSGTGNPNGVYLRDSYLLGGDPAAAEAAIQLDRLQYGMFEGNRFRNFTTNVVLNSATSVGRLWWGLNHNGTSIPEANVISDLAGFVFVHDRDGAGGESTFRAPLHLDNSGAIALKVIGATNTFDFVNTGTNLRLDHSGTAQRFIWTAGGEFNPVTNGQILGTTTERWTVNALDLNVGRSVISDGGGFKHKRVPTGSIGSSSSADVTVNWTTAFADANYTVTCSVVEADTDTATLEVDHIESITAATVTVRVENQDAGAAKTGTLHCIATHD